MERDFSPSDQALVRLHSHGRVTSRFLKLQCNMDDAHQEAKPQSALIPGSTSGAVRESVPQDECAGPACFITHLHHRSTGWLTVLPGVQQQHHIAMAQACQAAACRRGRQERQGYL